MTVLALVAGGAAGCPQQACDIAPSISVEGGRVIGNVVADCNPQPRSHDMTLRLQFEGRTEARRSTKVVPRPGAPVRMQVRHFCVPGNWAAVVDVNGIGPGDGEPFKFTDRVPRRVTDDECRRRS